MKLGEYARLSACNIASLIASRQISAVEVTRTALLALVAVDSALACGQRVGPLAGVPVVIKDLVMTKGLRTAFGSRLYADYIPQDDDIVVERLRASGAIIVGKGNASEFGFGSSGRNLLFETTRNPWRLCRTPGGSSAGSAAAVAAGVCPLSVGSDGGARSGYPPLSRVSSE